MSKVRVIAPVAILLILSTVAFAERWNLYHLSAQQMQKCAEALDDNLELPQIMSALKEAPPGRVYAGTRGNWGNWMQVGKVYLYDLLPIEQLTTVMPWQTLSLNAPLLWQLNIPNLDFCRLFNIRYIVAPPALRPPPFYRRKLVTSDYILYEIDSGGYLQLGQIDSVLPMPSSQALYARNRDWIASEYPAQGRFIAYRSPNDKLNDALKPTSTPDSSPENVGELGAIAREITTPDSFAAEVTATSPALLVFKATYHPNWHVVVDGREQHIFMVSPSFIGTMITPGRHQVSAEYRSSALKKWLLLLGCITLITILVVRTFGLESWFFGRLSE